MKKFNKAALALVAASTLAVGVAAPAANAATPFADKGVKENLVNVNSTTGKQWVKGKYKSVKLKSGTIFESSTRKSSLRGYVKVKKANGSYIDVKRSALKGVKRGAVQLTRYDSSIGKSKGYQTHAYTVKKSGKILTDHGWASTKNLKSIPLNTYTVKKTTKAVHGTGYVYGKLYKGERVTGFYTGSFSVKGQGKRWWIDAGNSLVNEGDLKKVSTYKINL